MKKILITSALPYVNNIPHLGNLIQVLSADVYARYCRLRGYDTLYVCGTDEYGTATETRALEEGVTPRELCDRYHAIHAEIYRWFDIAFDKFGRTSTPEQTAITQHIFLKLDENGYISEKTVEQTYCEHDQRFLADRYVRGVCPHCGYPEARGDQCENCGKLLDPVDLLEPRCGVCGRTPVRRETRHLYIDLPKILPRLKEWMEKASVEGNWARNAVQMTQAWIRDGLHERAITRDLKWGIPVPKKGYEDKVFYVWFDAPIGYISITATLTPEWEKWWRSPGEVSLVQFIGKDNIPFHTVIFPSSLLGSGETWTLLDHMSSTEYLNYESGKFSKSKGIGVFGTDAVESGIPADVWRFYIYYNRPEKSDSLFTWKDFQEKVNGELIGNLANLVNRAFSFVHRTCGGFLPADIPLTPESRAFWDEVRRLEGEITSSLERVELRDAFRAIFALASRGNKRFQDEEPWKKVKENRDQVLPLLRDLVYLIRDLAILVQPYLPATSRRIAAFLGLPAAGETAAGGQALRWDRLGELSGVGALARSELLFKPLEDEEIEAFRARFAGSQAERAARAADTAPQAVPGSSATPSALHGTAGAAEDPALRFEKRVRLKVGRITAVERHPKADKLYIESVDLGDEKRRIVSGLVPYYREDQLLGRHILLVANLKPARLRGVESQGMLLAAQDGQVVEVLFADHAPPGSEAALESAVPGGADAAGDSAAPSSVRGTAPAEPQAPSEAPGIDIDEFLSMPIRVADRQVYVGSRRLIVGGQPVRTLQVLEGEVR